MQVKFNEQGNPQPQQSTMEEDYMDDEYHFIDTMHQTLFAVDPQGAPSVSIIEGWKDKYKNLYISTVVEPDKYYVWRALRRAEYKKLESQGGFEKQSTMHDVLVEACLLYPTYSTQWKLVQPAGVIDTLGKQIAYNSGWISEQEALSAIRVI